jgi:hypothetical protein
MSTTAGLGLAPVVHTGFSLTPSLALGEFVIKFAGNADMAAVATLAAYLRLVHREAQSLQVKEVTFDLKELYFMNSSCFKSFVTWIDLVSSGSTDGLYRIKFLGNAKLHWQRRSLEALRCLAQDVVTVEA